MGRAWMPGDVVVCSWLGGEVRGIIDIDGRFYTTDQSVKGVSSSAFAASNLRPLLVLDVEDRKQAQRLTAVFCREAGIELPTITGTNAMQAALRSLIEPPRCAAALNIEGEHFGCDGELGHGMSHSNSTAGAIWGEGE